MMKSKRSKACDIPAKIKQTVWERDQHYCILCGSSAAMPNAHYIPRSQGGLGIARNIVTLCGECHRKYDQSECREEIKQYIRAYLQRQYPDWDEDNLVFKR